MAGVNLPMPSSFLAPRAGLIHFTLVSRPSLTMPRLFGSSRIELLSEHKEIKLSRGVRTTVWKRVRYRNEGLDLVVMVLCLLDVFRSQIDQMSGPQFTQDNGEKRPAEQSESDRPRWGAIYRMPLPGDTDGCQKVHTIRPEDNRAALGVLRTDRLSGDTLLFAI